MLYNSHFCRKVMNYLWKNLTKEEEINLSADELLYRVEVALQILLNNGGFILAFLVFSLYLSPVETNRL